MSGRIQGDNLVQGSEEGTVEGAAVRKVDVQIVTVIQGGLRKVPERISARPCSPPVSGQVGLLPTFGDSQFTGGLRACTRRYPWFRKYLFG